MVVAAECLQIQGVMASRSTRAEAVEMVDVSGVFAADRAAVGDASEELGPGPAPCRVIATGLRTGSFGVADLTCLGRVASASRVSSELGAAGHGAGRGGSTHDRFPFEGWVGRWHACPELYHTAIE